MKIKKKAKASSEIPAASMSDIAFLLIIFFMLTTVFSQDAGLKYQLPDSTKEVELEQKNLEIGVYANGAITIDGESRSIDDIKTSVAAKKLINPDIFVVIKLEPATRYGALVDVIDQVIQGQVENFAFQSIDESLQDFNKEFQLPTGE